MITSGETPLVNENDPAGAQQRVIEVECKDNSKVVQDGHRTASVLRANYGHAGKEFIERLTSPYRDSNPAYTGIDQAKVFYEAYYAGCIKSEALEKQAHAAALILTADTLAAEWIFKDNYRLEVKDIAEYLKTKETHGVAGKGYAYMCDWVAQNIAKLKGSSDTEMYGLVRDNTAYIIRTVFNSACESAGISPVALLSHLKSRGLIETYKGSRAYTVSKSINGVKTEYVAMKLPANECEQSDSENELEPL
jgi:hypothetical protein